MSTTVQPDTIPVAIRSQIVLNSTERLYTVVDACQAPELIEMARGKFGQPTRMLFKGKAAALEEVESFAPFFIPIDLKTDFLEHMSKAEPRAIFRHLRKIFVVQEEGGQEHFFRFYDPRVLRVYLSTCKRNETTEFFGPISNIIMEVADVKLLQTLPYCNEEKSSGSSISVINLRSDNRE